MKNLILAAILVFFIPPAFANNLCVAPAQSAKIYFGNGINTSNFSAGISLLRLSEELGEDHNGLKLDYALAYNETNGMAVDLVQVSEQLSIQINSRLMLWLNGVGIAPDWFSNWYQDYLLRRTTVVANEVADHANSYLNDILDGKIVIVVSHSQGNFYVNGAKELLARQLRDGKISSFAIFGVAVPSNNIGGSRGPYLTNHRDFIQNVPRSLPANWKLHRIGRTDAEDIGIIQAHLFNATYISNDFDIRPALIAGIRTQIDNAVQPSHSCETYNSVISSLVAGSYTATCGIKPNTVNKQFIITPFDMTLPDGTKVGTTGVEKSIGLRKQPGATISQIEFGAFGEKGIPPASAGWDANRIFRRLQSSSFCGVDEDTPPTSIAAPFSIASTMMSSVSGVYRLLPKGSCSFNQSAQNDEPIEFFVNGSQVRLGERTWHIASDVEAVGSFNNSLTDRLAEPYTDPGFYLITEPGDNSFFITYTRNKEIRQFTAIERGKSVVTCGFDRRTQRL